MLNIGIDEDQGLLYEGRGGYYGRAVWPMPVITPAKVMFVSEGSIVAERTSDPASGLCRFREDSFDPIARVRRGRFYVASGAAKTEWFVQPHPALPIDKPSVSDGQKSRKYLTTFYGNPFQTVFKGKTDQQPLVVLGMDDRFTVWTIESIEAVSTGEDLVTLKATSSLGVLPIVNFGKVPKKYRSALRESLEAFVNEVHRSGPVSVIDRARDAASQILLSYFRATRVDARDLAQMAERLEPKKKFLAINAARIIAQLHSRAKPVEKTRRKLRPIRAQDAELATKCVGTMLCELDLAEWA